MAGALAAGFAPEPEGSKVRAGHYDRLLSLPVRQADFRNQGGNGYYSGWQGSGIEAPDCYAAGGLL